MVQPASTSVSSTIRSSMIWNTLELGASQVLTIIIFMLLTYRLPAEVFGIFAIGAFFIDFLYTQAQTAATDIMLVEDRIERSRIDKIFGNLFSLYMLGFVLAVGISFVVSLSFDDEKYKYVLPVMCLCLVPIPFQIPAVYILNKNRDFKGTALRNVLSAVFGAIAALVVAFSPYPEWALVVQRIGQAVTGAIFVCLRTAFWPSFAYLTSFDAAFLRPWGKAFSAQALNIGQSRGLDLVIGAGLGAAALGILRVAMRLVEALYGMLGAPIGKLWVILLPEYSADIKERGKLFLDFTRIAAILLLPAFTGLYLVADELVGLLLDTPYAQVADILKVLCIAGVMSPFFYFRNSAFTATGRLNALLILTALDIVIVLFVAGALIKFGLIVATYALVASALVRVFTTVPILLSEFQMQFRDLILAIYPVYIAVIILTASVIGVSSLTTGMPVVLILALKVLAGAAGFGLYLAGFHLKWLKSAIAIVAPERIKT